MPDGSLRPLPPPTSTATATAPASSIAARDSSSASPMPARSFPLSARRLNPPIPVTTDNSMKAKLFGSVPSSPTTARPRTGHQSVRGRISGPIPIPNPLDDDEFPMRTPGTGIATATPIENDLVLHRPPQPPALPPASSSPVTSSFAPPPPLVPIAQTLPVAVRADVVEIPQTVPEHPGTPTQPPSAAGLCDPSPDGGLSSVSGARSSTARLHQNNPSSSARYSTISANSEKTSVSTGHAHQGQPQRKKSTLRSAIGRLLRRKNRKDGSLSSVSEIDRQAVVGGQQQQQQQHRSVPPAARNVSSQNIQAAMRVTSLPVSEFDRALRSHSIGPNDITVIESARNSIDVLGSSPLRKRAATADHSRLFTVGVPRSRGEDWAGLSPRPASTHARGSRFAEDDPNAIGRAITSDANADVGHKRRSRSLSQLSEVALAQGDGRRRSDEIRYWRQSHDIASGPLSPLSSVPNDNETEMNEETQDPGRASMSIADSSAERVPKTPPQPFNFGSLASMNEMAGMKITQAASLDETFGNLEARMTKLERVVNQLCHSVPGFKGPFMEVSAPPPPRRQRSGSAGAGGRVPTQHVMVSQPTYAYSTAIPPMIPHIYQTGMSSVSRDGHAASSRYTNSRRSVETTTDDNASSRMSIDNAYMDSLHPPSSSATQAVSTVATSVPPMPGLLRPTSEATVRPAASMPSLGSQGSNSGEERSSNSAALLAQLDAERAARQLLEDQVRKLSERMNNLSTTMFAMVRDPAKSKSQERMRPQTANSALGVNAAASSHTTSATATTTTTHLATISVNTGGRTASAIAPSSKAQSIFGKDATLGSVAGSPYKEVADDDFSEAFQTPREESTPGLGSNYPTFGDEFGAAAARNAEEDAENEEDRKKAARVLSLSQLTIGKGLPTRI